MRTNLFIDPYAIGTAFDEFDEEAPAKLDKCVDGLTADQSRIDHVSNVSNQ